MRRLFLAVACLAATYCVLAFRVLPQDAFFSSDEGLKLIQVQNFARKGWSDFTLDYPGRQQDPGLSFVPINNPPALISEGRIYSVYPVLFPLLTTPLFLQLGFAGLYVIPIASGLLALVITYRLAELTGGDALPSLLVLGLCTPLLFYSLLFWDHTLGTFLATSSLFLVTRSLRQHSATPLLAAGAMLGLAVWVRTELYVMAAVVPVAYFLFGGRRARPLLPLCLGTLAALCPLWVFQFLTYGTPLGPHIGHFASLGQDLPVSTSRLAVLYYTLLEANSNPLLTFLFVMAFAASTMVLLNRRLRSSPVAVGTTFGALLLCSLPNLLEAWSGRPLGGLASTTPFLAMSFAALSTQEARDADRLLLGVCVGYITVVCLATPVDPGLQWGPRFLLPVFPPAAVLALRSFHAFTREQRGYPRGALMAACLAATLGISLLFQVCGVRVMYIVKNRDRELIENIAQIDSTFVVSDEYGYAQYAAPLFYQKQFFYVRNQEDYHKLTETFVQNGIDKYGFGTYPVPHRRAVDPLDASDDYVVQALGHQLFQIAKADLTH